MLFVVGEGVVVVTILGLGVVVVVVVVVVVKGGNVNRSVVVGGGCVLVRSVLNSKSIVVAKLAPPT